MYKYKIKQNMLSNLSGMKKFYNRIEIPISTCYKGGDQITRDISAERAERARLHP